LFPVHIVTFYIISRYSIRFWPCQGKKQQLMKKTTLFLIVASSLLISVKSFAQIDNLSNMSAELVRSGTRNAATDAADIMVYNPGGVAMMKPGLHINVGNQSFFRKPTHEYTFDYGGGPTDYKYSQQGNDMVVPNIYVSYNKKNWAIFGGAYIAGGGATANFPNGSINTDLITAQTIQAIDAADQVGYTNGKDAYFKASSAYIATILGGAYKICDKLSVGVFARYLTAQNTAQAGVTITDANGQLPDVPMALDAKYSASGIGVVGGIDYRATEKLNLSVRYESQTELDFKTVTTTDDFGVAPNGQMNRRDFPGVLGLGAAYSWSARFKTSADFNYYFQTMADWGTSNVMGMPMQTSHLAGNSSTYGISGEYKISKRLLVSLGGVYSLFSYKDKAGYYTNIGAYETLPLNNFAICTGVGVNVTEKIRVNAGFLHAFYAKNGTVTADNLAPAIVNVKVNNSISAVALGVDFAF
jgi:long-chain fatty acid transport protein